MQSNYRIRFVIDPEGSFEECNGEPRPLTEEEYADAQIMRDGQPVSYADYLAYYGNPDRHVYMGAVLEHRCPCCGKWHHVDSLWRIDFMDDGPEVAVLTQYATIGGFAGTLCSQYYSLPAELDAIPGYLREITTDLLPDDADHVARTDADLITAVCDIIHAYDSRQVGTNDAAVAFGEIREIVTKRCEPVTGPDPRD